MALDSAAGMVSRLVRGRARDAWHKRLVKYYSYFGFQRVRAVGDNGLRDIPDLLVWGGVGMRMVGCRSASLSQAARPPRAAAARLACTASTDALRQHAGLIRFVSFRCMTLLRTFLVAIQCTVCST